jgi:hypothetical protein
LAVAAPGYGPAFTCRLFSITEGIFAFSPPIQANKGVSKPRFAATVSANYCHDCVATATQFPKLRNLTVTLRVDPALDHNVPLIIVSWSSE